jgi:hypothetical protein
MKYNKTLLCSVAVCALSLIAVSVRAETVVTKTITEQSAPTSGKIINLNNFDLNKNGILSTFEVGEMLFKLFDTDTSGSIDSAEYAFKSVLTVAPMEKTTVISYDYDNDGIADKTQYTFDKFTQDTQLARFDKNKDGLSPREFIDKTLTDIDTDNNHRIELMEWRNAYMSRIMPASGQ